MKYSILSAVLEKFMKDPAMQENISLNWTPSNKNQYTQLNVISQYLSVLILLRVRQLWLSMPLQHA